MAVFSADLGHTVVISAFTNTMAQSQVFMHDAPAANHSKWHFTQTEHAYCVGSHAAWLSPTRPDAQPEPISLEACKDKAIEFAKLGKVTRHSRHYCHCIY